MQKLFTSTAAYGIIVLTPQIDLTLMANIDVAARKEYGRDFQSSLQTIREKYYHNHRHDDASLKVILQELAKADSARSLKHAPAPGTTNKVKPTLKIRRTTV